MDQQTIPTTTPDRRQDFQVMDFSAGYVDAVDNNLLPDNASPDCENVYSPVMGVLKGRPGWKNYWGTPDFEAPIDGLFPCYFEGDVDIPRGVVFSTNGTVSVKTGDPGTGDNTFLKSSTAGLYHGFESCINYMVCFNGEDTPWKWTGNTGGVSDLEATQQMLDELVLDGYDEYEHATPEMCNPPDTGRYPILHKESLFISEKDDPSIIRWSQPFYPAIYSGWNFAYVKDGDGDEIVCMKKFFGELLIFKRRSTHALRGNSREDFVVDELNSDTGAVGPKAVLQYGTRIYVITYSGLQVFNGMQYTNISDQLIPKLWSRVNTYYLENAAIGRFNKYIIFSLPVDESEDNNLVLLYDPTAGEFGAFWPWTNINANNFVTFDDGDEIRLIAGTSLGQARMMNLWKGHDDDFNNPISSYWRSKSYDLGYPAWQKKAKRIFLHKAPESDNTPTLKISMDYGDYNNTDLERSDDFVAQYRLQVRPRWRYIASELSYEGTEPWEVRGLLIPSKIKPRPKVRRSSSEEE